jgi:glycosyltransferase involved in cell wall biosynthesis
MKILFNGYKNLFDGTAKKGVAGGPRLFTQQMIKHFQAEGHTFAGLVLNSRIDIGDVCEIVKHPAPGGEWIEVTMRLNLNLILNSKSVKIEKYSKLAIARIAEIIVQEKPDVVLLNGYSIINWYMLKAAHQAGIPVVVSHHGLWFKEAMEIMAKATATTVKLVKKMEKDIYTLASHQIFLNSYSRDIFEKEYKVSIERKSSIIPIPYNPLFLNAKLPKKNSNDIHKIGFVARWDAIKNPHFVYEIAKEAKRQKKNWKIHAVLKINKAEKLKYLRSRFVKAVSVIPSMLPKELKKFYQSMDLMILPSRFDVSPTVVMEAALQNRGTIISPNVGFTDEYKKMGMQNWIYDFGDAKKSVAYIDDMLKESLPSKFIEHIAKYHKSDRILKQYVSLLRSVIRKEKE